MARKASSDGRVKGPPGDAWAARMGRDSDGDGKIDFRTSGNRLSRQEFKKSDTNKDDMLDKNEYFAVCDSLLRLADQDKDGTLDANEFKRPEGNKLQRLIQ